MGSAGVFLSTGSARVLTSTGLATVLPSTGVGPVLPSTGSARVLQSTGSDTVLQSTGVSYSAATVWEGRHLKAGELWLSQGTGVVSVMLALKERSNVECRPREILGQERKCSHFGSLLPWTGEVWSLFRHCVGKRFVNSLLKAIHTG